MSGVIGMTNVNTDEEELSEDQIAGLRVQGDMKIIAIEGLDKAGKHTTAYMLKDFFENLGMKVKVSACPNYDGPIGKIIEDWLHNDFDADSKTYDLLQVADKQQMQTNINKWEKDGYDILIMDRYVHSVLAYGAYDNDRDWLKGLTKYLRMPDRVIYLDVEPEVSMHRNGKFGDNDRYESDLDRLKSTQKEYDRLFDGYHDNPSVDCVDANLPVPITKTQILEVAGDICFALTGEVVNNTKLFETMSHEDFEMIKEWYRSDVMVDEIGK